ncbi:MAG TPA: hypothetical protein VMT54_16655 [Candidatus Cybelea sp.]|nr:hypothetical protein [Candidatus Cybelea sp.]
MSEYIDDTIHVIRRQSIRGKSLQSERCGSFTNRARAETFIQEAIQPFSERGSSDGRWWCRHDAFSTTEYWVQSDASWQAGERAKPLHLPKW